MEQTPDQMFKDTKVLTISETGLILQTVTAQQRDPDYSAPPILQKALEYCGRFSTNKNRETLDRMRAMLADHRLSGVELAQVANLGIEAADEARRLVPSLAEPNLENDPPRTEALGDEELEAMLRELATYREFE